LWIKRGRKERQESGPIGELAIENLHAVVLGRFEAAAVGRIVELTLEIHIADFRVLEHSILMKVTENQ